jgi:hypothetical protein
MFKLLGIFAVLAPAVFGLTLLFAPGDRLFRGVRWMPLPMPEKNTRLYTLLVAFWRSVGAIALLFSLFLAYIIFID